LQSDDEQDSSVLDEEAVVENADGAILSNDISANSDGIPSTVSSGAAASSNNKKQKRKQEERKRQIDFSSARLRNLLVFCIGGRAFGRRISIGE
jgi:hypothetical protein